MLNEGFSDESTDISITYLIGREKPQSYDACVFGRARKAVTQDS